MCKVIGRIVSAMLFLYCHKMHENVRSLIIPFVLILNILLSSQWTICSVGTVGVQWGYNEGTVWNTRGTVGVQEGYRRGT